MNFRLTLLLLAVCTHMGLAVGQVSLERQVQMAELSRQHSKFIASFATEAKAGNLDVLLAMVDADILKRTGNASVKDYFEKSVIPFFAQSDGISGLQAISIADLPDGRSGIWHYAYIVAAGGTQLPFRMAIIETSEGPKVVELHVNECIRGRHPLCKG